MTPLRIADPAARAAPEARSALTSGCAALWKMADIGKAKPGVGGKKGGPEFGSGDRGGGGGVAVITRPKVDKKLQRKSKTEKEPNWRVLLHNDDVHTFDYVTGAIVKVVRTVSRKKAHRITMQAHSANVATVTTTWKALAEDYCKGLQMQGLTSSIAPDSSFKA
jgi:ATP-dependent Clp protease adapter protein ClpS